jgi:succinylglutamate desuccinylase
VHVHHRHALWPDDGFRMEPGFANLQRIREGELLARDNHGEIRAPETGVLLMPLYQTLGDDGFFLGREVTV